MLGSLASVCVSGYGVVMPAVLRDFLYLNERLTSMHLSELEGGSYEEEEQRRTQAQERSRSGSLRAGPLGGDAARGVTGEETTTRTVRQTPEAEYRRLEQLLERENGLQWLEAFDDAIWEQLRRGEALAIESVLEVPSFHQAAEMAEGVGPFADLMRAFGEGPTEADQEAIEGMTAIGQAVKEVAVVAHAAGARKYKFICPLDKSYLREDLSQIGGESVVVGSLQRRLKAGEKYSLLDSLGMGGLPRSERREAERNLKKEMPDAVVSPPAAILTPLAIYR